MKKKEIWIIKKNTGFIHYLNDIHSTCVYNKFFELLVLRIENTIHYRKNQINCGLGRRH